MWFDVGLIIYFIEVLIKTIRKNSPKEDYKNLIDHW
jgi:hypothetical protein